MTNREFQIGDTVKVIKFLLNSDLPISLQNRNCQITDKRVCPERSLVPDNWDYKVIDCVGVEHGWINGLYVFPKG